MIGGTASWNRATEHHAPVGDEMTDAAQDRASCGALSLPVVAGAVPAVLAVVWGLA